MSVDLDEIKSFLKDVLPEQNMGHSKKSTPKPVSGALAPLFINRDFSQCLPVNRYDEVYPGIILGNQNLAVSHDLRGELKHLKITHILNAAQGQKFAQVDTTEASYSDLNIRFMGIDAMDTQNCKIEKHLSSTSLFIDEALESGGCVFVHCHQGISRSATLVLAYLMTYKKMTLREAIQTVRLKRAIFPNDGFLKTLCKLNNEMLDNSNE